MYRKVSLQFAAPVLIVLGFVTPVAAKAQVSFNSVWTTLLVSGFRTPKVLMHAVAPSGLDQISLKEAR